MWRMWNIKEAAKCSNNFIQDRIRNNDVHIRRAEIGTENVLVSEMRDVP
jgi:hypothetical protein